MASTQPTSTPASQGNTQSNTPQSSVALCVNLKMKGFIQDAKKVIIEKIESELDKTDNIEMKNALVEKWKEALENDLKLVKNREPRETFQRAPPVEPVKVRGTRLLLKNINDANNYRKFCTTIATKLNYNSDFSDSPYCYRPKNARVYEAIKELYKTKNLTQEELDKIVEESEASS